MNEYLKKLLAARTAEVVALQVTMEATKDITEARSILENIKATNGLIDEMKTEIAKEEARSTGFNPLGSMNLNTNVPAKVEDNEKRYNEAFKNFITRGTVIPAELRTNEYTNTTDASAVIPMTVSNEIIRKIEVVGEIYNKVNHTQFPGGLSIPMSSITPVATWGPKSDSQKLGANGSVIFAYYGLEVKMSQSLISNTVSIVAFNNLFVTVATEAILKALDKSILVGTGVGEPLGISKDPRVTNIVTLASTDFTFKNLSKKVNASIPKEARAIGIYVFGQGTWDVNLNAIEDTTGQPMTKLTITDLGEKYRLFGKELLTTIHFEDFDTAASGAVVGVFFPPLQYVINSNLQLTATKWIDNETSEIKNKLQLIADGKSLDTSGFVIFKKA